MTIQTDAALQAAINGQLSVSTGGTQNSVLITDRVRASSTKESIFVVCQVKRAGRSRWVDVNCLSSATAQATSILAQIGT